MKGVCAKHKSTHLQNQCIDIKEMTLQDTFFDRTQKKPAMNLAIRRWFFTKRGFFDFIGPALGSTHVPCFSGSGLLLSRLISVNCPTGNVQNEAWDSDRSTNRNSGQSNPALSGQVQGLSSPARATCPSHRQGFSAHRPNSLIA